MQEVEHLVNMANQIADNFSFHDDAVDRTSDHLQRFWAPSMLRMLIEFDASGGAGLKPSVRDALKKASRILMPGGMTALPAIAGVVLAGGRSRRMGGVAKAFLALDDKPLLQHVIDRVRPQVSRLMLSVEVVSGEFGVFGLTQVPDPTPGNQGPLSGLLAAFRHLNEAEWLLLTPCDAPFLPSDLARRLYEHCALTDGLGAVVRYLGEIQPTFSLWNQRVLPHLEKAVSEDGMSGFKQFFDRVPLAEMDWPIGEDHVECSAASPFFNINDQPALEQARRLMAQ
jgi:molybdopterin-guanine dinucleotide biosynthesis protein A